MSKNMYAILFLFLIDLAKCYRMSHIMYMLFLIDVVDCYRKCNTVYYSSFNYGSLNPLQQEYIYSLEAITIYNVKLFL